MSVAPISLIPGMFNFAAYCTGSSEYRLKLQA